MPFVYRAAPGDLITHTLSSPSSKLIQHVYRVVSVQLGGTNQEGVVELAPISGAQPHVDEHGMINPYIPHCMFDQMVRAGIVECDQRECWFQSFSFSIS